MSWRVADEPVEGPDDEHEHEHEHEQEDDGAPEEEFEESSDDDEADPVEPLTHLSDEDYDAFVASELTSEGRVKSDPPVAAILIGLTLLIVLLWLWLA